MDTITHANYLEQLRAPAENYVNIRRIGQRHHCLYTLDSLKRGLCGADNKRFLLPDGVHTVAHGHHRIRQQQQANEDEDDTATQGTQAPVDADEEQPFLALTARQSAAHSIRNHTREEALDAIAGTNLRRVISHISIRRQALQAQSPPKKRCRVTDDDNEDCGSSDGDCDLRTVDDVAQFVTHNDAF